MTTVGSLCTGVGGLDIAACEVFAGEVAWCAEIDRHASTVLAARVPEAPNLGDFTAWTGPPRRVDVLAAGFPCQDISLAGKGAGLAGARSGLWFDVLGVIESVRPRWVVIENVAALRRRGLDVVLDGLEVAGYGGLWCFASSSAVGAPHRRKRMFVLAEAGWGGFAEHEPDIGVPASRSGNQRGGAAGRVGPVRHSLDSIDKLLPTPTARDHKGRNQRNDATCLPGALDACWGDYADAIARWESIHGPAPSPVTDDNKLAPVFVEWMMGYEPGWVSDLDIARTQQLKMLGNSVQPQAAAAALGSMLLSHGQTLNLVAR